jgi:hypothetical protein
MAAPKRTMTDAHKKALAQGRESGRAVREYLAALEANKPKRGRKVSIESLNARLDATNRKVNAEADPLRRLLLVQEALDLEAEIDRRGGDSGPDMKTLEKGFLKHAKAYSVAKGISYTAWREIGVTPAVLKAAGITRAG